MKKEIMMLATTSILGSSFLGIMFLAEAMYRCLDVPAEWARKFQHFFSGLLIAAFPWILSSTTEVVVLGTVMGAVLITMRYTNCLHSLHDVKRVSHGEFYFLISAILLYWVAGAEHKALYFISILTLTVSDALAAVIGTTYKKVTFGETGRRKSLEGSVAFFVATFLIVHLPLLLMTDIGNLQTVLLAVQVALIVTAIEAISFKGIDNVLIPLSTFYLLLNFTGYPPQQLAWELACQFAIVFVTQLIAWRYQVMNINGAILFQLVAYAAFAFGGIHWFLPAAIGYFLFIVAFCTLRSQEEVFKLLIYQTREVLCIVVVPLTVLISYRLLDYYYAGLYNAVNVQDFFVLFLSSVSANIGIIFYRLSMIHKKTERHQVFLGYLYQGLAWLLIVPVTLMVRPIEMSFQDMLLSASVGAIAQTVILLTSHSRSFRRHVLIVSLSTAFVLVIELALHLFWRIHA